MKELNNKLDGLSELVTRIDAKILDINTKLDELIKALHAYDDENIEDINEGYGESSFESFMDSKDDILNWKVDGAERRIHHVTNEEADEDANKIRMGKDKDSTQDKHVGKKKRDKWVSPYPPNPKRKFTQDLIPKNEG
jgi:spore cortex formation protein SpoVR/YcgB (stage V sporulation)